MNDNLLILPENRSEACQEGIQPETGLLAVVPLFEPGDIERFDDDYKRS